ncbi:MAG: carbon-nitrogen hydrolase family protein [Anaerolineae bacterium]|jgi:predicted amidohydrolase
MRSEPNTGYRESGERRLKIAAVQMDANPAPTTDRLARAERLVTDSAKAGARLVVLPEVFNTGYAYNNENHTRVETIAGPTASWMREIAARLGIYLAGSLMLLEEGEVYNTLLLFAPDDQMWRYDKQYPWGWERGYFRASCQEAKVTVAQTELGDLGMLICWDAAHPHLWASYAGRVDLMMISSSPPSVSTAAYHFPDGDQLLLDQLGPIVASTKGGELHVFGELINQQTAWLGVPAVQAVGCGQIRTEIPKGRHLMLGNALTAPRLLKYLPGADRLQMVCNMVHECKVVDGSGKVLAGLAKEDGEAVALATVSLAEAKAKPQEPQPGSGLPKLAYWLSDVYLPALAKSVYRQGQRRWRGS